MAVVGALSVAIEVPDFEPGIRFYSDAGLVPEVGPEVARFRCEGQSQPAVILIKGNRKRLHHIALRAEKLSEISERVPQAGGKVVSAPAAFEDSGLWVQDPNGLLIHLADKPPAAALALGAMFEVNAPGRIVRSGRSAVLPRNSYTPVRPLRLGHILTFSPDVESSVRFATEALGMGLADQSQDVIAFCCARRNSDHHVLAFAKSPGLGFHHVSFQVNDPDEVGRGGATLVEKAARGHWGFGRHTIGSNFFHYVQDPWGSWLEYYSDMDHIEDHALWTPTNYGLEDSLASWGPPPPDDFVHNYEADAEGRFEVA